MHNIGAGPAILVANHRSYFDATAVAMVVAQSGRTVRFLGKKEVFGALVRPAGEGHGRHPGRARLGLGRAAPPCRRSALEAGQMVALMPEGTIPREGLLRSRAEGPLGAARLAVLTEAPVIPIGVWGTEKVWPRSARLPNILNVTNPPTVQIRVGPPVALKYRSADADTKRIMKAIVALLPDEARAQGAHREELRTLPAGLQGRPRRRPPPPGAD